MIRGLERLLNLRPGEFSRGFLLFLYLFLIISSYVLGKAARDALFLAKFTPIQLTYADMTVTVLVGFIVALYIWISRRVTLRNLIAGSPPVLRQPHDRVLVAQPEAPKAVAVPGDLRLDGHLRRARAGPGAGRSRARC